MWVITTSFCSYRQWLSPSNSGEKQELNLNYFLPMNPSRLPLAAFSQSVHQLDFPENYWSTLFWWEFLWNFKKFSLGGFCYCCCFVFVLFFWAKLTTYAREQDLKCSQIFVFLKCKYVSVLNVVTYWYF